ncbi:MAG: prepilin-type N-terminal cleavage/methylation domain-containing protein [Candidatus Electrothrix sp. EH2]|nr:prepilin-type N-terminal cleavage/methylation domain-containing protein [Candidatus Electrothrix sp. EH2]
MHIMHSAVYNKQGFTLLELIIVMVLISLTASFALPKILKGHVALEEDRITLNR